MTYSRLYPYYSIGQEEECHINPLISITKAVSLTILSHSDNIYLNPLIILDGFTNKECFMDNITSTLISQLLDKALENTEPEERLAFVEKLFSQLPPAGQQEFLLSLTRMVRD